MLFEIRIMNASIICSDINSPPFLSCINENFVSSGWHLDGRLVNFCRLYGFQALTVLILIVITFFRREMSCNHDYISETEGGGCNNNGGVNVNENEIVAEEEEDLLHEISSSEKDFLVQEFTFQKQTIEKEANSELLSPPNSEQQHDINKNIVDVHNFKTLQYFSKCFIFSHLPSDTSIYLLSFLNPKDLTVFSCASHNSNKLASNFFLWKILLLRDYHFILTEWPIAQSAFQRFSSSPSCTILDYISNCMEDSNIQQQELNINMKRLYFTFTRYWIDWSLAGLNTFDSCYIGLHNSVFNITNFLRDHPGSPETILMYAGRDATEIFEDLGHSRGARDLAAKNLCVINLGYDYYSQKKKKDKVVVADPNNITADDSYNNTVENGRTVSLPMMRSRSKRKSPGVLLCIKQNLEKELKLERRKVKNWRKKNTDVEMLGDVNIYYDPFFQKWRWWYSNIDMQPIFINSFEG